MCRRDPRSQGPIGRPTSDRAHDQNGGEHHPGPDHPAGAGRRDGGPPPSRWRRPCDPRSRSLGEVCRGSTRPLSGSRATGHPVLPSAFAPGVSLRVAVASRPNCLSSPITEVRPVGQDAPHPAGVPAPRRVSSASVRSQRRHEVLGPRRTAAKTYVAKALTLAATPGRGACTPAVALLDALSGARSRGQGRRHPPERRCAPQVAPRPQGQRGPRWGPCPDLGPRQPSRPSKAAAAKAAKARIAAGKSAKAKGAQTAAGKARAALSKTARAGEAAAVSAASPRAPPAGLRPPRPSRPGPRPRPSPRLPPRRRPRRARPRPARRRPPRRRPLRAGPRRRRPRTRPRRRRGRGQGLAAAHSASLTAPGDPRGVVMSG